MKDRSITQPRVILIVYALLRLVSFPTVSSHHGVMGDSLRVQVELVVPNTDFTYGEKNNNNSNPEK